MNFKREITVNTGEQGRVYEKITEFFNYVQRIVDAANDNLLAENCSLLRHPHFERRVRGTRPLESQPDTLVRPDDAVHMLLYKDKVVAVVTESRDDHNYVQFSFFDNLEKMVGAER
jgi:hypothetical protein